MAASKVKIDKDFDAACSVQTDQPERIAEILQDTGLRSSIQELLRSRSQTVSIDEQAVRAQFFKVSDFKPGAQKILDIAVRLSSKNV